MAASSKPQNACARKPGPSLTQERLKSLLKYDPQTGVFLWLIRTSRRTFAGDVAGSINPKGYRVITIERRNYGAHRLAVLWMTGMLPTKEVDHENLHRSDNRWENLRVATRTQNRTNSRAMKNNSSGYKGVYPFRGRWRALITSNYKNIHLGLFNNPEDAHAAYCAAAQKYHGEFARTE